MTGKHTNKIAKRVSDLQKAAFQGRWKKEVEKFDAEQAVKDRVKQANKAIKDRRGIT